MRFLVSLLFPFFLLGETDFELELFEPSYEKGRISAQKGGVLQGKDLRLQAETIYLEKKNQTSYAYGQTNVLLQYKGAIFRADRVKFDLTNRVATLTNVVTYSAPFYVQAQTVVLEKTGQFTAYGVELTTQELHPGNCTIETSVLRAYKEGRLLEFEGTSLRLFSTPFWLPSFRLHLQKFSPSLLRYKLTWDRGSGPRFSVRYRAYSWRDLAIFLRGEYRLKTGFGGAVETEYLPENSPHFLLTKNYLASDVVPNNLCKERRYRLQGLGHISSEKEEIDLSWDKYSDPFMPGDFSRSDFEISTEKKTFFSWLHQGDTFLLRSFCAPKVNRFQTVYQKLPEVMLQTKPYPLGNWIGSTLCKAAYNNFSYTNRLAPPLDDFSSGRFSLEQTLARNASWNMFFARLLGTAHATCYTQGKTGSSLFSAQGTCALELFLQGRAQGKQWLHHTEPYTYFCGYSPTASNLEERPIFSVEDGRVSLYEAGIGWKNRFLHIPSGGQGFFHFFSRYFLSANEGASNPLKTYVHLEWEMNRFLWKWRSRFRSLRAHLDAIQSSIEWTVNKHAACSVEAFYYSRFFFRKARRDLFFLEKTRPIETLLASPLSARRIGLAGKAFYRFTPFSTLEARIRQGQLLEESVSYLEYLVEIRSLLAPSCELRWTFEHTENDDRFSFGIEMLRG